jgi:hypothetical protein
VYGPLAPLGDECVGLGVRDEFATADATSTLEEVFDELALEIRWDLPPFAPLLEDGARLAG